MRPDLLALMRASDHIIEWLSKLEPQLDGDDPEIQREYLKLAATLATITPQLRPEVVIPSLTQQEVADRLGVTTRTVRRRAQRGELPSKRAQRAAG